MATRLLYLEDFDIYQCYATVKSVSKTEDDRDDVVLDRTCFYPRGGGQDWDKGFISLDGGVEFVVQEVHLDESGEVHHIGRFNPGIFKAGDEVDARVDITIREANSRLHSAGHVIDMAMNAVMPAWIPGKGAHYPHMSFVEYSVLPSDVADEDFRMRLQAKVNELVKSTFQNRIMFMHVSKLPGYCRHVPENLPTGKQVRVVLYANDFGIPCGGTHVRQLKDVGELRVTKIKIKKNVARVSYELARLYR